MDCFFESFPHLTTLVLEMKIPNHRPILLLEYRVDYGQVPFHLFHSWFDMDGFDGFVRDSWS